jgi:4-diphosphocytidyl-2-C-methyl-D-erythritol kinase
MLKTVSVKAPAKINLYLKVMPKRADGYHSIESIFQKIPLFDDITVTKTDLLNTCSVQCKTMKLPIENTITGMYREFVKVTGISQGVSVDLVKRIPSGAGLGGGSSDAAYFLNALDIMFDTKLDVVTKHLLATKIGSDVPFFLGTECALVTGRGEIIQEIQVRKDLFFVLVIPEVNSSTKEAYALLDEWMAQHIEKSVLSIAEVKCMYANDVHKWTFTNTFSDSQIDHCAEIGKALSDVRLTGALFAEMSGSGSSVFGVYLSEKKAKAAADLLLHEWKRCWMLPSCDCACVAGIR